MNPAGARPDPPRVRDVGSASPDPWWHLLCRVYAPVRGWRGRGRGTAGCGWCGVAGSCTWPARQLAACRDPLTTNCVAMHVCGGCDRRRGHNLAVFCGSCTLNCLMFRNWRPRDLLPTRAEIGVTVGAAPEEAAPSLRGRGMSAGELAEAAASDTFCMCCFGGDPTSQMPHALAKRFPHLGGYRYEMDDRNAKSFWDSAMASRACRARGSKTIGQPGAASASIRMSAV